MRKRTDIWGVSLVIFFLLIVGVEKYSLAQTSSTYHYFPSEIASSQLALTAQGDSVKMTYTPATYEIRLEPEKDFIELQIFDAPLKPGSGSEDVNENVGDPFMKLVFLENGSDWSVTCSDDTENILAKSGTYEIPIQLTYCQFNEKDWSEVLRVYPGSGKSSILMKTVWDDAIPDENYGFSSRKDLINVFKFRTKNGTVNLAQTDPSTLIQFPGQTGFDFKIESIKQTFAHTVNWSILYNTSSSAIFDFEIDVAGKSQVLLFDKDADANKLYGPTTPADDGITMSVVWNDGNDTPIKDWTIFDQTNRSTFTDSNFVPGEQNSYQGPSGDTGPDPEGVKSIQWYKIPVSEQKANSIKVTWSNFSVDYNGFGFASTSSVKSLEEEVPPDDPLEICSPTDLKCLEALEKCDGDLECQDKLKECNGDPVCIEDLIDELEEEFDPTLPKCQQSGYLRACISSTPFPDPHPDSYLEKGDTITYHITLENISTDTELKNLNLGFNPPIYTSLHEEHFSEFISEDGTYTGKGAGRFDLTEILSPGSTSTKNVKVVVDTSTPLQDYDITTEDRITAAAENNPSVILKSLTHHVGEGAVKVTVSRCYAFDYYGGEFECNTSCSTIEPGTKITVRDTLTNHGGTTAYDHTYFPPPLSSSFEYEENSIRIDHPTSGLTSPNDGNSFPPTEGITIPGPIESNGSRTVFFSYYVPDDLLESDPPTEEEERDGKCYPKESEEGAWSGFPLTRGPGGQEGSPFTPISFESDCPVDEASEEPENGLICVKVEENPKLDVELMAITSPENPVYQGTVITYTLRVTNTTRQAVANLIIEGYVPSQTTCKSGNCNGLNLSSPPELQEKGTLEYSFTVQVNENATGSSISHSGQHIIYKGDSDQTFQKTSNPVVHTLMASPEPTGAFQHDIAVSRRTVLNAKDRQARADQGDASKVTHEFEYTGTRKYVSPFLSDGRAPPHTSTKNFCNEIGYSGPSSTYDAPFNSQMYVYASRSTLRNQQLFSYSQISNDDIIFTITTDLPNERPEFLNISGRGTDYQDVIKYQILSGRIIENGMNAVNYFMRNGGGIEEAYLEYEGRNISQQSMPETNFRAVSDGQGGEIIAANKGSTVQNNIPEDLWQFIQTGNRPAISCSKRCGKRTCRRQVTPPEYKWVLISSREIRLEASDKDYVTALTSVAWLQTKYGHMGFGTPLWSISPSSGDPNWVQLSDRSLATEMKFYTPANEYNADFIVFSADNGDPLRSKSGQKISSGSFDQGFLASEGGTGRLSRGEAYDRAAYPRDYLEDLLNKQVYGKVVRLNNPAERPIDMPVNGTTLNLSGSVSCEPDSIYYFKGDAIIGSAENNVILSGGRARLVIEGNTTIRGNISYDKNSGDLNTIPSLRLHTTGNITIDPHVTDVELMMLAENEFHSGRSDQQLRILGDVIAYKTFWERSPLNQDRETDEMVNKPSEIIYEDFRKYVLTPPGDKKLPDSGHFWKEVKAGSGK